jgi:hypothetical protein
VTDDDLARAKAERDEAVKRAARDAPILAAADTVISDARADRAENHWADMVRDLFRGK